MQTGFTMPACEDRLYVYRFKVSLGFANCLQGHAFEAKLCAVRSRKVSFKFRNHCLQGHAFEARLYAESVANNFLPATGTIRRWRVPPNASLFDNSRPVRVDSGVSEGDTVRA